MYMRKILLALLLPFAAFASQSFTATSNTLLASVGASLPSTGSVSVAFYPTYSQSDGTLHFIYETDVTGGYFRIVHDTSNLLVFSIVNGSGNWSATVSTYTMPSNTWAVVTAQWANGAPLTLCFNGVFCQNVQFGGNLIWTSSNTTWSIGNTTAGGNDTRGLAALVGVWNRALTSDEVHALSLFYSPKVVAASGLLHDWDLIGSALTDSVGGITLTASGTSSSSDQSPLFALGMSGVVRSYGLFY